MKIYILIAILLISSISYGASYQGKVTNVFAYQGKIFVRISNGSFNNSSGNCSSKTDGLPAYIDVNTEYGKALLSIVLIAKTTEKTVWVNVSSNSCLQGPYGPAGVLSLIDLKG
jgi:hypothetical protein